MGSVPSPWVRDYHWLRLSDCSRCTMWDKISSCLVQSDSHIVQDKKTTFDNFWLTRISKYGRDSVAADEVYRTYHTNKRVNKRRGGSGAHLTYNRTCRTVLCIHTSPNQTKQKGVHHYWAWRRDRDSSSVRCQFSDLQREGEGTRDRRFLWEGCGAIRS